MNNGWKWFSVKDGDAMARGLFNRHYSRHFYKDNRKPKLFVGPGEKLVLMTTEGKALFVWRKFKSDNNQEGINCAIFRNEGEHLSSELILEAEEIARQKWPDEKRFYTYINSSKIKSSNPGYCFLMAGWQKCGITKTNKLIILEKVQS